MEGSVSRGAPVPESGSRVDLDGLKDGMSPVDPVGYYRKRAETGVDLGPSFRTLASAWARPGEALG